LVVQGSASAEAEIRLGANEARKLAELLTEAADAIEAVPA